MTDPGLHFELRRVRLEPVRAVRAAHGDATRHEVLVLRVADGTGHVGWGECAALELPGYSSEYLAGCWHVLTTVLIPIVASSDGDIHRTLGRVAGHQMAKSTVIGALIDLDLRSRGRSLTDALSDGGTTRRTVPSTAVLGIMDDLDALMVQVDDRVAAGHGSLKLKIRPGWDEAPVRAVRSAWPDVALAVDANGAYPNADVADDALRTVVAAGGDALSYVEQPLAAEDLVGTAVLARRLDVPVALDESVGSIGEACTALALGAMGMLNVKPARVGGPIAAMAVAQVAAEEGKPVFCGGMFESGIGRSAALAFAAQAVCTGPTDLGPSSRYVSEDLTTEFTLERGCLTVPDGLGIGVEPDLSTLERCTVDRWTS